MSPTSTLAAAVTLAALVLFAPLAEAAEPKRVLIVHSFGRDLEPYNAVGASFRNELTQVLDERVAYHDESLDSERGGLPDERLFVDYPRQRETVRPDLVVAIANPAMLFCLRYREQLFPDRPILITGIDRRRLENVGGSLLHVPGMGKRSAELAAQMLQGEDPARPSKQASLGLASMRERVRMLRGEFEIDSTPSRGTTVVGWVPATSDQ